MFSGIHSRFCLAAAGAMMAMASLLPLPAQGQLKPLPEKVKVNMTHVPSVGYAGLYVAIEKGYFAQRGLDVELHIVRGGDTTYQVAGQTIEFSGGSADSAFFNSLQRGMPLVLISSLALNSPGASSNPIVVRKDLYDSASITTLAQLKGRRVANLAPGGIAEYLLSLALEQADLSVSDLDLVTPMGFSQMAEAFRTKAIEASLLAEPFATLSEQRGDIVRLSERHDSNEQMLVIKTTKDYAEEHPDVVKNFLAGFLMGARDLQENGFDSSENIAIIEKYTKLKPEVLKAAVLPVIPPDGELNVDSLMKQQKYYMSRGYVKAKDEIPPDTFIDTSYLQEARSALGAK
ncbi:hypothetical protein CSC67_05375 [Pusillimonas caeni]|uniref:ABC transporter substrate-binding protein n=1 Tax=Pusillimonas caeni TaxID=1348472 RepID=UPI000E59BDB7|nr:ABC transporter substrate-binding protein [Pusillimonas caeni]TFL14780.1 hypothetical protein CSC67_05375 [Pusillimonas caeni]